jgi:hypothetical protein
LGHGQLRLSRIGAAMDAAKGRSPGTIALIMLLAVLSP